MSKKGTWRATLGITTVLLLCLVLAVAGCGKKDEGDVDGGEQVTTEEMKQTFDVETGQYFDFSLESNPTTGYTWQADRSPDGKIVQLVSNDFLPPSGDLVGAPGEEVWQFQAVGVGSTTMVLEYSQAWDTETPPAKRYTLTVNVAQGDNEINQSFKLEAGKTFDLTLDTNPSAGYSWSMTQQPDANILKLVSNDVTGGGAMGAPQQQVWRFQAVNAGNTSFVLEYKGPGASAPVERKDNVKVTVTAAPAPAPTPPKTYTDPSAPITAQRGEVFILQVKAAGGGRLPVAAGGGGQHQHAQVHGLRHQFQPSDRRRGRHRVHLRGPGPRPAGHQAGPVRAGQRHAFPGRDVQRHREVEKRFQDA